MKKNSSKFCRFRAGETALVIVIILVTIAGIILVCSPFLENMPHQIKVQQNIENVKELVAVYVPSEQATAANGTQSAEQEPLVLPELLQAMQEHNQDIYQNGQAGLCDAWSYQQAVLDLSEYGLDRNSAVGLVAIPDINVEMPLYLGANQENLSNGFAQLSQTSMPIGGISTNCVIAGHRGWKGMAYMRDVELLDYGDSVFLQNPWKTMEYRIKEILLIQPNDLESIYIQEGRDLLTIITCHPYGVGTHRYVLICERYFPEADTILPEIKHGKWTWEWQHSVKISASEGLSFESSQKTIFLSVYLPWICAIVCMFLILIAIILFFARKRRYS